MENWKILKVPPPNINKYIYIPTHLKETNENLREHIALAINFREILKSKSFIIH